MVKEIKLSSDQTSNKENVSHFHSNTKEFQNDVLDNSIRCNDHITIHFIGLDRQKREKMTISFFLSSFSIKYD